jgi:NitT/TauT family transport system substrate-binding protein
MKLPRLLRVVIALAVAMAFLPACERAPTPQNALEPASGSLLKVRWGGPRNISMLPLLAEERGLFTKEGLSAEFIDIQSGKKAIDALRAGDIDLGVGVDMNIALAGYEGADDLRIIASIQLKSDDALIVASGELQQPNALAGQTIGVTLGTTTHAYLVHYLARQGMKPEAATFQNMPPPAIQAALLNGSLKAGALWQPFRHNVLAAKPDAFVEWKDPEAYTAHVLLVCTKKFLDEQTARSPGDNDNAITRFLRALIAAEADAAQHPRTAITTLAEKIPLPADVLTKIWAEYQLRVFLNHELLELLQTEGRWIRESVPENNGKPVPEYRPFIAEKLLQSIASDRVKGL